MMRRDGGRPGAFGGRTLGGNQINIRNQNVNLAGRGYRPSYTGYGWYGGHWGGNWGWGGGWGPGLGWGYYGPGWGWGYWGGYGWRPLGWGLGAWGLGSLIYGSGYLPYWNPYYSGYGFASVYDYSQPIPVDYGTANVAAPTAQEMLGDAMAAFRRNDYDTALDIVNRAIAQSPNDAVLHEFRALVLFAKADYQQAAATIHSVLALGPGWDWKTLSSLYDDLSIYTLQLRALEQFVSEHPQDGGPRFLLAYHYLSAGHSDAAASQLQRVVEIVPEDRVAQDLLRMLKPPTTAVAGEAGERPAPQPPAEATLPAKSIAAETLIGTWSAARDDGSKFELNLAADSSFTWKFSMKNQPPQVLSGKYTLDGNILSLERREGGALVGEVSPKGDGAFNFRMVGAPPDDKGLDFSK